MGIKKNMISNFLLSSSSIIFPLITFPYVTRTLSSNSMGKYFFIDALTQYFIIFSAVGIPYYGIREIARIKEDKPGRSALVIELFSIQFTLALLLSALFLFLHYFIPELKTEHNLVKTACLYVIGSAFMFEWFYQGIENFTYITSRSLIIKTLSVLCILLLVKKSGDYFIYYLITTMLVFCNAALNSINYIKNYHCSYQQELNIKRHIKPLLILFSISVSVSVYAVLDTIILGLLTNPENVSLYNVPLKLVKIFWTVVNGAGMVLIPRIASMFVTDDTSGIQQIMQKSMSIVFLLTVPFCFFCLVFPNEILTLISGQKYLGAANALRILSVVPIIISLCNVCGTQFLMPIGREQNILHGTLLGLAVGLTLNFLFIPYFKFMGAAITCVITEGVVCGYIVISASKRIKLLIDYRLLLQILLSLAVSLLARCLLAGGLQGLLLLVTVLCVYCITFLLSQLYFKNAFVQSLLINSVKIKTAKSTAILK